MVELRNGNCLDLLPEIKREHENIIIVTDPPFNVGYKYNEYKDNLDEEEYYEMLESVIGGG